MGENDEADRWARAARERGRREREGGESLTDGAKLSAGRAACGAGPPGPRRGEGESAGSAKYGPAEEGEVFPFSLLFLISNSFLFLFLFLFLFPLNQKFSNAPFGSLELNSILIIVIKAYINYDNSVLYKIYLYTIISKMSEIFM
jgi:hypothetical protein